MPRLSVATWPPPGIITAVGRLSRPADPRVTWAAREQWLVKLRPLGHVAEDLVAPLIEALRDEPAGAEPAACSLGPRTRRLGGQWLGVPVEGLDTLAATVFDATVPLVPVTHPQPFQADIVIARGRVPAALAGEPVSGTWLAETVALVADRSSPHGPRLEDLTEFRLSSPSRN